MEAWLLPDAPRRDTTLHSLGRMNSIATFTEASSKGIPKTCLPREIQDSGCEHGWVFDWNRSEDETAVTSALKRSMGFLVSVSSMFVESRVSSFSSEVCWWLLVRLRICEHRHVISTTTNDSFDSLGSCILTNQQCCGCKPAVLLMLLLCWRGASTAPHKAKSPPKSLPGSRGQLLSSLVVACCCSRPCLRLRSSEVNWPAGLLCLQRCLAWLCK